MDNKKENKWKSVIKNVLDHFRHGTIGCNQKTKFKMSGIKNPSISSNLSLFSQQITLNDKINTFQKINNQHSNKINACETENLNNISDNINDNNVESATKGSILTLASITNDNSYIQNDLYKQFSKKTNSEDSLFLEECPENLKHKQPIMGKAALLKKSNLDRSDSFIVHSIILNKYEDILNHYVNRMYKRRISRISTSEDEYSENSTFPRYSPSTVSSMETPRSISDSQKYYFGGEKQFYSVDELNMVTPKENFNGSSFTCYSNNNETSICCSEYDQKKFLANALGDLASLESDSHKCTTSNIQIYDESVGTSHVSSLLSKTDSSCSPLQGLHKRKNSKEKECCLDELTKNNILSSTSLLELYKRELSKQNSIIFQISKALNYCKKSKEFFIGRERLEAEKILLVATLSKEALISEINTIEFNTYKSIFDPRCTGKIKISNICFNLIQKTDTEHQCDYQEYFLVILTCGKTVLFSEIIEETNGLLEIKKTFKFEDLLADFEIDICVYSIIMHKKDYISQEQFKCPSPKSIFKCNRELRHCKISSKSKTSDQIAFIPIGRSNIRNSEISYIQNGCLGLTLEPESPRLSLSSSFELKIKTNFELSNRLPGFLTIGLDNGKNCLTWNRRWCVLDGFLLKYWNYPSEETSDTLGQLDIRTCTIQKILLADRSLCAKPKTLFLPIRDTSGLKNYFLAADTQSDLQMWEAELNFVIQSILIWQVKNDC